MARTDEKLFHGIRDVNQNGSRDLDISFGMLLFFSSFV